MSTTQTATQLLSTQLLPTPRRVELGKTAREMLSTVLENLNKNEKDFVISVLLNECKYLQHEKNSPPEIIMSYEQARKFGEVSMPFGAHVGEKLHDIELRYLQNLCDPSDFVKKLKLYVKYRSENPTIRV